MPGAVAEAGGREREHTPVELVRRAQEGDEQAFSAIYRARSSGVFRYARSILNDGDAAEDVTAQTFLQAWSNLPALRKPERFDSWLFRIAHNVAISETRRRRTSDLDEAPEPVDETREADPAGLLAGKFDAAALRAALEELPEATREIITLRFFAGLSHEEVAAQVGKSAGNVRVIQHRALSQLRELLEARGLAPA